MKVSFKLVMVLLGIFSVAAFSQGRKKYGSLQSNIKFEHFTTEDGLGHNQITSILQDRRGFLWVGTLGCLWRYDGYNFRMTRYAHDDPFGLSAPEIQTIYEDSKDNLWVGLQTGGLNLYNRETGKFIRFHHDPDNPNSISAGTVRVIYESPQDSGTLWLGTSSGLCRMTFDTDGRPIFFTYRHEPDNKNSLSHDVIHTISQDSTGALWLGTAQGLDRFEPDSHTFTRHRQLFSSVVGESSLAVVKILHEQNNQLWLGTNSGLIQFNIRTYAVRHYRNDPEKPNSLSHNRIHAMCKDISGALWIGTQDGLNHFNPKTETFTNYRHDLDDPASLSENVVLSLYQDKSGVLWIGSRATGLNKLPYRYKNFEHYSYRKNAANSLNSNRVTAIHEDQVGRLWVGTDHGLNIFARDRKSVAYFNQNAKQKNSLSSNRVTTIDQDKQGGMWVGTFNGLNLVDLRTRTVVHYTHDPQDSTSLSHPVVTKIHQGQKGTLWIGTVDGVNKLVSDPTETKDTVHFARYYPDPRKQDVGSDNFVQAIYADASNNVWVGTREGLSKIVQSTGEITNYQHNPQDPHSLSYNNVWSIFEDSFNQIWVGTANMLDLVTRDTNKFKHYDPFEQRSGYGVGGILEDKNYNLWFNTSKGLATFYRATASFRHYDVSDGLQSGVFSGANHKNANGEMFYGGKNGFNAFFPGEIRDNLQVPSIVFTKFTLLKPSKLSTMGNVTAENIIGWSPKAKDGQIILKKEISQASEITLSNEDNSFSIEFAALDFIAPQQNQYAYRLVGIHDQWLQLGNQRSLIFTNLEPDDYVLQVKGSNNDGIWNGEPASLRITVLPPWWRSTFAYLFYALLTIMIFLAWRRYDLKRIHLQNELQTKAFEAEKLKEVDRLKSRFFANISHEFRTPLTLILGPLDKLLSEDFPSAARQQFQLMKRNAQRLKRLINQLLDLSKIEAGSMKLSVKKDDIVKAVRTMALSFSSLADRKRIDLAFRSPYEIIEVYFDHEKLEKIISNLLSNALKFTPEGGEVKVELKISSFPIKIEPKSITGKYVEITVDDSGGGIPVEYRERIFDRFYQLDSSNTREQEGTGIGLELTKDLVKLHHGHIEVGDNQNAGTSMIVRLPLGKSHLRAEEITEIEDNREVRMTEGVAEGNLILASAEKELPTVSKKNTEKTEQPRVTIVEDNADVRSYIRSHLDEKYRISEAENGENGLSLVASLMPDLIISDIMMPRMDGIEFCEKIKTNEITSHIPVILLTARAASEDKLQGLETGADDYIIKPFNARELKIRVKNLIEQRRLLRERFSREIMLQPNEITVTSYDERFLKRALELVENYLADTEFSTETFAREVGMSRMQLNRKLQALTNLATGEFIRSIRLKQAAQLLAKRGGSTIVEIAYQVGFNSPAYFSKCFRQQFGHVPSEYVKLPGTKDSS